MHDVGNTLGWESLRCAPEDISRHPVNECAVESASWRVGRNCVDAFLLLSPDLGLNRSRNDETNVDSVGPQLEPNGVIKRPKCKLTRAIRSEHRRRDLAGYRTDVDYARSPGGPCIEQTQQRQHGLGHGDGSEKIHVKFTSPIVQGSEFRRPDNGDAGIIHEPKQSVIAGAGANHILSGADRRRIRHIKLY